MKTITHFGSYLAQFYIEWEMFQTKVVEKSETHILCSINFIRKLCRLWMWENTVEPGSLQMAIWGMRIACRMPKAINTYSQYVISIAFPL